MNNRLPVTSRLDEQLLKHHVLGIVSEGKITQFIMGKEYPHARRQSLDLHGRALVNTEFYELPYYAS
jgi:hypothetical protein